MVDKEFYKDLSEQLQLENQELKQKINTYENPNDLTLIFMYCNEKARDMIEELKEQLEVGEQQYNGLVEEKENLQEQLSSNTLQFENQQKEFIEWLERKLFLLQDEASELVLEMCSTDYQDTKIEVYKEVLSKYKEIIGSEVENNAK